MTTPMTSALKPLRASELTPPLNVRVVDSAAGLEQVADFFSRESVFGMDCETNVTPTFFRRRIRTIQVGNKKEQYVIDLLPFAENTDNMVSGMGNYTPAAWFQPIVDTLRPVFESDKWLKVGHNLQFDYEVLKWCLGLRPWNLYDTLLTEKLRYLGAVNVHLKGFWGLEDLMARYFGLLVSKEYQTSFNLTDPLTPGQIEYCGLDTRLPLAIKNAQYAPITKENLARVCQIEYDAIPAFGDMHLNGMLQNTVRWRELLAVELDKKKAIIKRLDEFFTPVVGNSEVPNYDLTSLEEAWRSVPLKQKEERADARLRYQAAAREVREAGKAMKKHEGDAAINYGSNDQLYEAIIKLGFKRTQLKDTNDNSLRKFAKIPERKFTEEYETDPTMAKFTVIDTIRFYRQVDKIIDTYGESFIEKYTDPDTGRIHSEHVQIGADTGRTASRKPNLQNILSGADWRGCFVARPEHKLITADYDGQELRIMAEYSGEPAWLGAFEKKWDVHSMCADMMRHEEWQAATLETCTYALHKKKCKCPEHKSKRDDAKTTNFAIPYGQGLRALAEKLGKTEDAAKALLALHEASFPLLHGYLKQSAKRATMKLEARTQSGRRRLFTKPTWGGAAALVQKKYDRPATQKEISKQFAAMYASIEREGKNTPIQGSGADWVKTAMGCGKDKNGKPFLWHTLEPSSGRLLNMVHDELVAEAPDERAEQVKDIVCDAMARAGQEFCKRVETPADAHINTKWSKE